MQRFDAGEGDPRTPDPKQQGHAEHDKVSDKNRGKHTRYTKSRTTAAYKMAEIRDRGLPIGKRNRVEQQNNRRYKGKKFKT